MLCAVHVIALSCRIRNSEHSQHFFPLSNDRPFNAVHSHFSPSITFRNHSGKDILKSDDRMTKIHCKTLNWEALCVEVQQVHSLECVCMCVCVCVCVCVLYLTNTGNKCPTHKKKFQLPHYIILEIKPCYLISLLHTAYSTLSEFSNS
jgi:hypothetical protein